MSNVLEKDVRIVLCVYDYKNEITNIKEQYRNNVVNKDNLLKLFNNDYDGRVVIKKLIE